MYLQYLAELCVLTTIRALSKLVLTLQVVDLPLVQETSQWLSKGTCYIYLLTYCKVELCKGDTSKQFILSMYKVYLENLGQPSVIFIQHVGKEVDFLLSMLMAGSTSMVSTKHPTP